MPRFCDPGSIVTRPDAGKLPDWTVLVVATACVITFVAVTIGVDLALRQIDHAVDRGWLPFGLTFVVAFGILASWLPPARLSRALRVAVLLPALHAVIVVVAWPAWTTIARFVTDHAAASALVTDFPIARVVAGTLVGFAAFAYVVARRRDGEWLHGFVMLSLAELLLIGVWLPISCEVWPGATTQWWTPSDPVVGDVGMRVAWTVAPPTLVAMVFTALALRRPRLVLALRRPIIALVAAAFALACVMRIDASARVMVLYSNQLPIALAAMLVAVLALILFGAALAMRVRRTHRALARRKRFDGVIVADDLMPVFGYEITSWLRGPRIVQRPFAVATRAGTIPISGAHLVAMLPPASSQLHVGECIAVLQPGDRVMLAGPADTAGDPFRTSASPIASDVLVAPAERGAGTLAHVALAMWRPCVAYLWIVVAVAIPALAALAAV
jgi:hypothetical protein